MLYSFFFFFVSLLFFYYFYVFILFAIQFFALSVSFRFPIFIIIIILSMFLYYTFNFLLQVASEYFYLIGFVNFCNYFLITLFFFNVFQSPQPNLRRADQYNSLPRQKILENHELNRLPEVAGRGIAFGKGLTSLITLKTEKSYSAPNLGDGNFFMSFLFFQDCSWILELPTYKAKMTFLM